MEEEAAKIKDLLERWDRIDKELREVLRRERHEERTAPKRPRSNLRKATARKKATA